MLLLRVGVLQVFLTTFLTFLQQGKYRGRDGNRREIENRFFFAVFFSSSARCVWKVALFYEFRPDDGFSLLLFLAAFYSSSSKECVCACERLVAFAPGSPWSRSGWRGGCARAHAHVCVRACVGGSSQVLGGENREREKKRTGL